MADYLVTYRPLVATPEGRRAAACFALPPYVDASCRREPDLTHELPAITAICRGAAFAPHLQVGDRAIYLTVAGRWDGRLPARCWKLVAALRVIARFESHDAAAAWYRTRGLSLPRNLLVPGNPPEPWERTGRELRRELLEHIGDPVHDPERTVRLWDARYQRRAAAHPVALSCAVLGLALWSPPTLTEAELRALFGRVPPTRTPPRIAPGQAQRLIARLAA